MTAKFIDIVRDGRSAHVAESSYNSHWRYQGWDRVEDAPAETEEGAEVLDSAEVVVDQAKGSAAPRLGETGTGDSTQSAGAKQGS